jgi:hypothetical protein
MKQAHTITATSPEGKVMQFNCPTLREAQELADVMKADGFTSVQIDDGPAFAVYSLINHSTEAEIFGVLDSDGFDALGEGFDTREEAQKVADELNAQQ